MNRKLLILDLDETLIYATEQAIHYPSDFRIGTYDVYKRPFLDLFLERIAVLFDLAVWTSASPAYAVGIVDAIFPPDISLRFVWAGPRCTQRREPETGQYYWVKDLKKVKRLGFPLEQVLMLDDSPEKLERQYGNLVRIPPFMGKQTDTALRDVLPFLEYLSVVENVRTVEKRFWRDRLTKPSYPLANEPML